MRKVQVFDPAMCCPTGVCGASFNPELPRFAADLEWLKSQAVQVERYSLAHQIRAFIENEAVRRAMEKHGPDCLPLLLVDGRIVSMGRYPTRDELTGWTGTESIGSPVAVGSNGRGGAR